ncbi:MAG: hypothetical protein DRJ62_04240, partial [Thermoprotei archaeon]
IRFSGLKVRIEIPREPKSLEPLDNYDVPVDVKGDPQANEDDAWNLLRKLREVWVNVASKLS